MSNIRWRDLRGSGRAGTILLELVQGSKVLARIKRYWAIGRPCRYIVDPPGPSRQYPTVEEAKEAAGKAFGI